MNNSGYIKSIWLTAIIGIIGFIYLSIQSMTDASIAVIQRWIVLIVGMLVVGGEIIFITKNQQEKIRLKAVKEQNELLEENYNNLRDIYDSNAILYHDLNHHMLVLHHMLDQKEIENAKEYIETISRPIQELKQKIWTNHKIIDTIINSKVTALRNKGGMLCINAEYPSESVIELSDINIIIGNLLDNAIEAVTQEVDKTIYFSMRKIHKMLVIQVTNTCSKSRAQTENGLLQTSKKNVRLHGIGLKSVITAAQKYNGVVNWKQENRKFCVTVLMNLES